eukprot:scaffold48_cov395-Prasinococcus_capsulatus_cf.AAC.39
MPSCFSCSAGLCGGLLRSLALELLARLLVGNLGSGRAEHGVNLTCRRPCEATPLATFNLHVVRHPKDRELLGLRPQQTEMLMLRRHVHDRITWMRQRGHTGALHYRSGLGGLEATAVQCVAAHVQHAAPLRHTATVALPPQHQPRNRAIPFNTLPMAHIPARCLCEPGLPVGGHADWHRGRPRQGWCR